MQFLNRYFCAESLLSLNEEALLVRNMAAPTQSAGASAENECQAGMDHSTDADFFVKCG